MRKALTLNEVRALKPDIVGLVFLWRGKLWEVLDREATSKDYGIDDGARKSLALRELF